MSDTAKVIAKNDEECEEEEGKDQRGKSSTENNELENQYDGGKRDHIDKISSVLIPRNEGIEQIENQFIAGYLLCNVMFENENPRAIAIKNLPHFIHKSDINNEPSLVIELPSRPISTTNQRSSAFYPNKPPRRRIKRLKE